MVEVDEEVDDEEVEGDDEAVVTTVKTSVETKFVMDMKPLQTVLLTVNQQEEVAEVDDEASIRVSMVSWIQEKQI